MAQIRQSRFGVRDVHEEDIYLFDLAGNWGVIVEIEHQYYSDELREAIRELEAGDIIQAKIQGEDVLQPNSIWRFLEFEKVGHNPAFARNS